MGENRIISVKKNDNKKILYETARPVAELLKSSFNESVTVAFYSNRTWYTLFQCHSTMDLGSKLAFASKLKTADFLPAWIGRVKFMILKSICGCNGEMYICLQLFLKQNIRKISGSMLLHFLQKDQNNGYHQEFN